MLPIKSGKKPGQVYTSTAYKYAMCFVKNPPENCVSA